MFTKIKLDFEEGGLQIWKGRLFVKGSLPETRQTVCIWAFAVCIWHTRANMSDPVVVVCSLKDVHIFDG